MLLLGLHVVGSWLLSAESVNHKNQSLHSFFIDYISNVRLFFVLFNFSVWFMSYLSYYLFILYACVNEIIRG